MSLYNSKLRRMDAIGMLEAQIMELKKELASASARAAAVETAAMVAMEKPDNNDPPEFLKSQLTNLQNRVEKLEQQEEELLKELREREEKEELLKELREREEKEELREREGNIGRSLKSFLECKDHRAVLCTLCHSIGIGW
jgi:TolA-binding protein